MRGAFERLVVPISGSEADARALDVLPALIGKEGGAVTFLCSEEARWVNAQRLEASGGMFL